MTTRHRQPGCVAGGTLIHTDHGLVPAARLARMRTPPSIASYDHIQQRFEYNRLVALRVIKTHHVRELKTETRRSLWCGDDHPIYMIGRGYAPAHSARPGQEVIAVDDPLPSMEPRSSRLPWPWGRSHEDTRPATQPVTPNTPAHEQSPLPIRRRDWIRTNRIVRTTTVHTLFDFRVARRPNYLADGILVHSTA